MRLMKSLTMLFMCLLLLSVILFADSIPAEESVENNINAHFDINMISATDFRISCEITVNKIKLSGSGTTYTSNQIESFSTTNPGMLGAISYQLQISINETLSASFKDSEVKALNQIPTYKNGKFYDDFSVNLTSSYFGINETINSHDFLNGVLDMGAYIEYDFNFQAKLGWNNTYAINLGTPFDFQETNGEWNGEAVIEWDVINGLGMESNKSGMLILKDKYPTTKEAKEDILLGFQLNATGRNTILQTNILVNSIGIQKYDVLPTLVKNLNYISSDGIRLFVANDLFSWNDIYQNTIKPIEQKIKSTIEESSFNQTLDMAFSWDDTTTECLNPYDVGNMDDMPSVKAILKDDDINLKICDISARGLFGLLNSGAKATASNGDINFGERLKDIGYAYNISLSMPSGIKLKDKNIFTWNATIPFEGDFKSGKNPYASEDVKTTIEIEIKNTDLDILSFFEASPELVFGLNFEEKHNYNVTTYEDKFNLPEKISIKYLSSDALRVCVEEGIFTDEQIKAFLENEKTSFENKMKTVLNGLEISGHIDKDTFYNSLAWNGDINKMDAQNPVKISSYAYSSYPTKFDLSLFPPSFSIPEQKYYFSGIKNQSVTYKMIFPKGTTISVEDSHNKAKIRETADGREYIKVAFTPYESDMSLEVSCKITPSPLFVFGLLMPCSITLFILIILIIIIFILKRKRKKRKAIIVEEAAPYGNEEYYAPPPGSK